MRNFIRLISQGIVLSFIFSILFMLKGMLIMKSRKRKLAVHF